MAEKKLMVNLNTFAKGALYEQFNEEYEKILNNIDDPNTDAPKARKLTVTVTFKPNNKRNGANVSISTKSSLVPVMPIETSIIIDKDLRTGKVLAAEYSSQIAGQVEMEVEDSDENVQAENVIDLKKANNK